MPIHIFEEGIKGRKKGRKGRKGRKGGREERKGTYKYICPYTYLRKE
jgi:hypothetical protein